MAQKNINIVYNVDTQAIQVAKVQVDQAKQATDQLTQSAKNFGEQAGAGAQKFAGDIAGLKAQMQLLKTQIDLTNQSDTATLNQRIALYKEMQAQLDKYNSGLKDTQVQTQNIGSSFNGLYSTIRAVITAGLLKELVSVNLEMARLSGQVEGVKRAFDRLPNSTLLMEDLKQKTHNTLSELVLMQKAVQAQNFKIPLEQLGNLLEFAAVKAQQTGLDINYLTDSIITGLGRGSLKILDNLQFSITELKEKTKEFGSQQKAVFFLVNEQMQKMGGYAETSATKVDLLAASWRNFKVAASQSFASGGVIDLMNQFVAGLTLIVKSQKQIDDEFNKGIAIKYAREFLTEQNQNIAAIDKEIDRIKQQMQARGALKATIKEQFDALKPLNHEDDERRQKMSETYKTLAQQNDISQKEIQILKEKQAQLQISVPAQEKQIGYLEQVDEQIKNLNEDLLKLDKSQSGKAIEIQVKIKQLESDKADFLDPDRASKQAKAATDKINSAIGEEIRSNSETILKGVNKTVDTSYKELQKGADKDFKQFIAGLKLAHKEQEQEEADHQKRMNRLMHFLGSQLFTNARQIAGELVQLEVQKYDDQISAVQEYYSNQETLAGTNSKRVAQLQKEEQAKQKQLEKERKAAQKKANIEKIEIDTAANVIRSILENGGIPFGLPFGAIAAAFGFAQIALVNKFAKGVIDLKGQGTETSDSIPSMLSVGESVMTAEETRNSGNILRGIRSKKLNDEVLEKLTVTTDGIVFRPDNSDVVRAIEKNKSPDFARQFATLYEIKEGGKNMKRIIRSKSFNN